MIDTNSAPFLIENSVEDLDVFSGNRVVSVSPQLKASIGGMINHSCPGLDINRMPFVLKDPLDLGIDSISVIQKLDEDDQEVKEGMEFFAFASDPYMKAYIKDRLRSKNTKEEDIKNHLSLLYSRVVFGAIVENSKLKLPSELKNWFKISDIRVVGLQHYIKVTIIK